MEEVKLSGKSKNIISENILKMMKIFPEVVVDNKINFEKLKFLLGEDIEESNERFMFTWPGKAKAVNSIKIPTTGTLRPCKDESINWDTTKNLYIKGNNIDVLKLLQKGYYKKVKAIYIDVPYNAGQDIIYKNDYKDSIDNYLKITGQRVIKDGETVNVINNTESNGRYHSNWLCEMYPCLDIAKELLDDEGIIFIAIDDHEFSNLKQITDDIFNEINYIGTLVTKCNPQGRGKKNLDPIHEYHLIYAKNINLIAELKLERNNEDNEIEYQNFRRSGTNSRKYERPNRFYPMLVKENKVSVITQEEYYKIYDGNNFNENHLGYLKDKYEKLGYQVIFPIAKNGEEKVWQREYKRAAKECNTYIYEGENIKTPKSDFETPKSLWYEPEHSNVEYGTNLLKKLFDGQKTFEYPKSIHTVKELISMTNEGIILDFFAGSSTTAHAVMQLNAENDTNYQYIMVQIPAIIGEDENAYALGYRNICQVGIDRIKKAGKEIEKENPQVDIGFKVFNLDSSNLKEWDPQYENISNSLDDYLNNRKEDRSDEDLIYELLLKYGVDLRLPIITHESDNNTIYSVVGESALLICVDDNISKDISNELLNIIKNDLKIRNKEMRIIFNDNGFVSDEDKINISEKLRSKGFTKFVTF